MIGFYSSPYVRDEIIETTVVSGLISMRLFQAILLHISREELRALADRPKEISYLNVTNYAKFPVLHSKHILPERSSCMLRSLKFTGKPPNCIASDYKTSDCIKERTINCTFIRINKPRQVFHAMVKIILYHTHIHMAFV